MDQNLPTFLIERIRQQAQAEGAPLSQEEEAFLETVAAGHKDEARAALQHLKEHESLAQFGQRLAELLMRAYEEDVKADPQAKEKYAQLSSVFAGGSGLFSAILPLVIGRSLAHHTPPGIAQRVPTQRDFAQQDVAPPAIQPKSSFNGFLIVLVFLIIVGLILWMVISKR